VSGVAAAIRDSRVLRIAWKVYRTNPKGHPGGGDGPGEALGVADRLVQKMGASLKYKFDAVEDREGVLHAHSLRADAAEQDITGRVSPPPLLRARTRCL